MEELILVDYGKSKIWMLTKFTMHYPHTTLVNDELIITKDNLEAFFLLNCALEKFKIENNFELICDKYLNTVKEEFEKCRFKIDYDKVYPLIKSKEFGLEENVKFVREDLFLDLDVLYAMDIGETFRFILKNANYNFMKLKQSYIKNLNMFSIGLRKLD